MGGGGRTWPQCGAVLSPPHHQCVQGAVCQRRTLLGDLYSTRVLLAAVGGEGGSPPIQKHGWIDRPTDITTDRRRYDSPSYMWSAMSVMSSLCLWGCNTG